MSRHTSRRISPFYTLWQWLVAVPVFVVNTIITATLTVVGCLIGPGRFWGWWPPKIWARINCYVSFVRVRIEGIDNLRVGQSYVFASNHQSVYDIFSIYGWLPVQFKWIMKKELERVPFIGRACKSAGHIFIERGQTKGALESIAEAKRKLVDGVSVVIFPEGARTPDGEVKPFKRGGFQIAHDLGLPVVPMSVDGAYEVMPRWSWRIKPRTIHIRIHAPIAPDEAAEAHRSERELAQKVRDVIVADLTPNP